MEEPQPTSIASLKKKRKQQDSQPEKHLAKHVCREEGDEPARGCESEPESTNSNSFHSNYADSFMCSDDEDKTDGWFQETCTSDELAASSASWAATSSGASPYSSEYRSFVNSSTSDPESLSMDMNEDQHDQHDVGFGWEGHAEIELYTDKELEDLLYSNGAAHGGTFILSSGRWSVDQGARAMQEEGKKKLTIDEEFEQFFSMLSFSKKI